MNKIKDYFGVIEHLEKQLSVVVDRDIRVSIRQCIDAIRALIESGLLHDTYCVGEDAGREWILCFECGLKSYHPVDVKRLYCGHCHRFHER